MRKVQYRGGEDVLVCVGEDGVPVTLLRSWTDLAVRSPHASHASRFEVSSGALGSLRSSLEGVMSRYIGMGEQ
ncbi:hypothetical protein CTZ27_30215 [Streptomyces griseocarneus]|nr:hypothetical protein CTZ27_30215 [Streptomyces griseocarneus]